MSIEVPPPGTSDEADPSIAGRFNVDPLDLLARAGERLGATLDIQQTLAALARLVVPELADWCAIDIHDDGPLRRLALVQATASLQSAADELRDIHLAHEANRPLIAGVRETARAELHDDLSGEGVARNAVNARHAQLLHRLGVRSLIVAPLLAQGRAVGVLTLVAGQSGRRYTPRDLALAEELARRASLAVDNARLYAEARAAQAELRQGEESFRRLFETNPLPMLVFDTATLELLEVNAAAVEQYGYARDEFLRRRIADIWMPEDLERRLAFAKGPRSATHFNSAISQHRGKDGRVLEVRVLSHRLHFAGREARLLTMQHVGDQLRAEERLRESDEHLKRALTAARMATFDWDVRTDVVLRSPGHEALFGLAPGSMESSRRAFLERVHPEDRARIEFRLDAQQNEPKPHDHEFRVIWPDGSIHWLARRCTVFFGPDGAPVRMVGTTMDVTEWRSAEEAARRSNERLARTLESMSDAFFALDAAWRFTYVNHRADAMMRESNPAHSRALLLGKRIDEAFPAMRDEAFAAALRDAQRTGQAQCVDVCAGPSARWWELTVCPSEDGISVFYRDVTERKRAEQEREELLAERQREAEQLRVLHQRLQQSVEALLGLHEVGQVLNATRDIDRMGARLLEIARRAASLDAIAISRATGRKGLRLWKRSGSDSLVRAARGTAEARRARCAVLDTGQAQAYTVASQPSGTSILRAWCVPLRNGDHVVGVIEAFAAPGPDLQATIEILGSMAHQLATAMQNARLYGDLARNERALRELVGRLMRVQEEERRRLALEVHDGLAQLTTSAQMHLEAFAYEYPPLTEKARVKLETSIGLTRQSVSEIRRVLSGLRPRLLDDYGLGRALAVYIEQLAGNGWDVRYCDGLGAERLPDDVETALFRLAQEALANVVKHAETRRMRVELDREDRAVRLEVRDWGRGFDPSIADVPARPGERLGLLGMRERVSVLGGQCEVSSRLGEGTRVVARVPVADLASRDRALT